MNSQNITPQTDQDLFDDLSLLIDKPKRKGGWPKRHTFRNGKYYRFYKIYNTLDAMIHNQKTNERLNLPLNFTKHEIKELEDIRERLETLRKNRFQAYWEIKRLE